MVTDILKGLYTGSISEIYSILNRSIYITEIQNKQDALLFHTGFGFKSHRATMFYLYYDLKSAFVIRSPEIKNPLYGKIPQLLGLLCPLNGSDYINNFYPKLTTSFVLEISKEVEENIEMKGLKGINQITLGEIFEPDNLQVQNKAVTLVSSEGTESITHKNFEIQKEEQIIATLPLYKTFNEVVFINNYSLEKYDLNKYKRETKQEWQSDEDWYRSEFGDAANDAWWNTH
jgi:hypothetical protein